MKRLLASVAVVIAAAGAGLATTATQASAAPHPEAVAAETYASASQGDRAARDPYVLYSRYDSLAVCREEGLRGELHGRWRSWYCFDNRPLDVQLWVKYR
ncbi:hypothetical protein [Streptomyces sp. NRRL S-920]|uniref:hypothetical protein n=1 Tax=Streptomyces sp. NRRL S-920 TaxID=1463921 RepID=UPI0004C5191C|nr:hypothetical protein [Streptomyces sp. NRRL S-920]